MNKSMNVKRSKTKTFSTLHEEKLYLERLLKAVEEEEASEPLNEHPLLDSSSKKLIKNLSEGKCSIEELDFLEKCTYDDLSLEVLLEESGAEKIVDLILNENFEKRIVQFLFEATDRESDDSEKTRKFILFLKKSSLAYSLPKAAIQCIYNSHREENHLFMLLGCIENVLELDPTFLFKDTRLPDSLADYAISSENHALYASEILSIVVENRIQLHFVSASIFNKVIKYLDKLIDKERMSLEENEIFENLINFIEICSLDEQGARELVQENVLLLLIQMVKLKSRFGFKALKVISALLVSSQKTSDTLIHENFHAILLTVLIFDVFELKDESNILDLQEIAIEILSSLCINASLTLRPKLLNALGSKEITEKLLKLYETVKERGGFLEDLKLLIAASNPRKFVSQKKWVELAVILREFLGNLLESQIETAKRDFVLILKNKIEE